ncbi:MAG: hypothetical protein M1833_000804 [Piccolia ochrophora]|nr:MAG: hypothetical protein M1833_000804 [Piccolia ochrophora]
MPVAERTESNPLISPQKASDGLHVLLHPLVLLTISDYITRHTLRRQEGPIAGALLGQQLGREISLEHAFESKLAAGEDENVIMDPAWFDERIQQFKDVHKAPALELVGWFTIAPTSGPQNVHLPIHRQILHTYNESAVLLAFHPSIAARGSTTGGQLPLTIYESVYEASALNQAMDDDTNPMETRKSDGQMVLQFRELPYTVETGEAEMISVDFVARGGGNATDVEQPSEAGPPSQTTSEGAGKDKGKAKAKDQADQGEKKPKEDLSTGLSPEDEELISSLTARANAIRMLHSRIQLIQSYLKSLPPSYLTDSAQVSDQRNGSRGPDGSLERTEISHPVLRSIQALVDRLPLLVPTDRRAFELESLTEKSNVSLVALLGGLNKSIKDMKEAGRKFGIVESQRSTKRPSQTISDDFFSSFGDGKLPVGSWEA